MASFLSNMDIAVSGMIAQRLRMDIISENVANATTTRTAEGGPYTRQVVVFSENRELDTSGADAVHSFVSGESDSLFTDDGSFSSVLSSTFGNKNAYSAGAGVVVTEIAEDETPYTPVYDPSHPDADEDGYYYLPNVDTEEEIMDAIEASNSYQSCLTLYNTLKSMAQKALTIGS